ncbi:hypothetical protein [Nocardia jejuensis]|uniref:hypothetical protein n=1 Tax=Nocardia jejuensis TaxID=328049 RepID=UPI0014716836|nr:hypothetical protein [Nocardia jejuensis]
MGAHPQRTPFYGVLLLITFMIAGLWARDLPWLWLRVVVFAGLVVMAVIGFVMTFRDYS